MKLSHLILLSLLTPAAVAAQGTKVSKGSAKAPAAPYVAPKPGTKYVYTGMSTTVLRTDGWKTWFRDHRGGRGMWHGLFITGDPGSEISVPDSSLRRLWPLKVGNVTDVITTRGEEKFLWRFTVTGTETVRTAAGSFLTYRVDGVQQTVLTPNPATAVANIYSWWYAPSVRAVVQVNFLQAVGSRKGQLIKNELIAIERDTTIR
jgi:hypothetical protein